MTRVTERAPSAERSTTLSCGPYTAVVDDVGAALVSLRLDGRDLVFRAPGTAPVASPPFAGAVLAPWPNRIGNGRYDFGGRSHQLPVDEVGRGNALHGLTLWERWERVAGTHSAVELRHTLYPRPGYPFTVALSTRYALDADRGLTITVSAYNVGDGPTPVGLSTHPYLTVGDEHELDAWHMRLPCANVIETDDRLLPRRQLPVADAGLDFRTPRRLDSVVLDHAFSVDFAGAQSTRAELEGPAGDRVCVSWGPECAWLQVYTLHAPGQPMHRRAVAVEPMTCAPDAFNSGAGLTVLQPGASTSMWCAISG